MQVIDLHVMYPRLSFKGQLSKFDNYSDGGVMKKRFPFILMLLVLILTGCSMSNGFNGNAWGSSIESVKSREGIPYEESIVSLSYNKQIYNADADITYFFGSNRLESAIVIFNNLSSPKFLHIASELSKTYGEKQIVTESERNGYGGAMASVYGGRVVEAYGWAKGNTVVRLISFAYKNGDDHVELHVNDVSEL